jgi:hypothetical protein
VVASEHSANLQGIWQPKRLERRVFPGSADFSPQVNGGLQAHGGLPADGGLQDNGKLKAHGGLKSEFPGLARSMTKNTIKGESNHHDQQCLMGGPNDTCRQTQTRGSKKPNLR